MADWVSNDPEVTAQLRKADQTYESERRAVLARNLPLAQKVEALRLVKAVRQLTYDAIRARVGA